MVKQTISKALASSAPSRRLTPRSLEHGGPLDQQQSLRRWALLHVLAVGGYLLLRAIRPAKDVAAPRTPTLHSAYLSTRHRVFPFVITRRKVIGLRKSHFRKLGYLPSAGGRDQSPQSYTELSCRRFPTCFFARRRAYCFSIGAGRRRHLFDGRHWRVDYSSFRFRL